MLLMSTLWYHESPLYLYDTVAWKYMFWDSGIQMEIGLQAVSMIYLR